jgi:hypothetical protein
VEVALPSTTTIDRRDLMSTNAQGMQVSYADLAAAMTMPSFAGLANDVAPSAPSEVDDGSLDM